MTRVEAIVRLIEDLSRAELAELRRWFEEHLADQWDRQIERDATSGRLDHLMDEAESAFRAGECSEL